MRHGLRSAIVIILCCGLSVVHAQDPAPKDKHWSLSGYVKSMQGLISFADPFSGQDTILTDAFLHSRLNFDWYPSDELTFKAGLRSRFFFGGYQQSIYAGDFAQDLRDGNDVVDLELINTGDRLLMHSIFDRLYMEYSKGDWEVRLGRQRINWGISTIWNPHDIFNAFTFTDFDYEERPGSDALRVKRYIGYSGSVELAVKAEDDLDEAVAGAVYKFNKWDYDMQLLAAWSAEDVVMGLGWAGSIKQMGFKAESSYFLSTVTAREDVLSATVGLDYAFKNGLYLQADALYNGSKNEGNGLLGFDLQARNLYPYQWSVLVSGSHPITPLIQADLAAIYSPVADDPLFLMPRISYSIAQDLDIDLTAQVFLDGRSGSYESEAELVYLRMRWSF